MITIEQLVQREVNCCLSSLVSTLAAGSHAIQRNPRNNSGDAGASNLYDLCEQAIELASPVLDYEEGATQEGWEAYTDEFGVACWRQKQPNGDLATFAGTADELCSWDAIEPYEWDVFEHWSVSTWLAEQLEKHGEKVDTDFAGMCVWARTTTGQGISADSVIERIYADVVKS
jgi:hypothetical protein